MWTTENFDIPSSYWRITRRIVTRTSKPMIRPEWSSPRQLPIPLTTLMLTLSVDTKRGRSSSVLKVFHSNYSRSSVLKTWLIFQNLKVHQMSKKINKSKWAKRSINSIFHLLIQFQWEIGKFSPINSFHWEKLLFSHSMIENEYF